METKYPDYSTCPRCGGPNRVDVKDTIEGHISEVETACEVCGHEDYWAYGWYARPCGEEGE